MPGEQERDHGEDTPELSAGRMAHVQALVQEMPDEQKLALARVILSQVPPPDQSTSNTIWLIVIWFFCSIMAGAAIVLFVGVFVPAPNGGVAPDKILTIFTTITAFLAGLFTPSPVTKKG